MREEIKNLWEQTEKDFEVAEKNFKIKEYYVSAFFCQQSVEKTLKAFFMISKVPICRKPLIFFLKTPMKKTVKIMNLTFHQ